MQVPPPIQKRHGQISGSSVENHQGTQGLKRLSCKERRREGGLFSLEKTWFQGDLIAICQYLQGSYLPRQSQALISGAQWEDDRQWA